MKSTYVIIFLLVAGCRHNDTLIGDTGVAYNDFCSEKNTFELTWIAQNEVHFATLSGAWNEDTWNDMVTATEGNDVRYKKEGVRRGDTFAFHVEFQEVSTGKVLSDPTVDGGAWEGGFVVPHFNCMAFDYAIAERGESYVYIVTVP